MKLDELDHYLNNIRPPLREYQRSTLSSMFYNIYLEGVEEGKKQVRQGIYNLIEKY